MAPIVVVSAPAGLDDEHGELAVALAKHKLRFPDLDRAADGISFILISMSVDLLI